VETEEIKMESSPLKVIKSEISTKIEASPLKTVKKEVISGYHIEHLSLP